MTSIKIALSNMMCQSDDTLTPWWHTGGIPTPVIKYTTGMKFRVHLRDAVGLLDMRQVKVFRGKLLFLAERHGVVVDKSKARAGAASSAYSGNLCCCCQAAT